MNCSCVSYTFTVTIDKNLPSQVLVAVISLGSELITFVLPYIAAAVFLVVHFFNVHVRPALSGLMHSCGSVCENAIKAVTPVWNEVRDQVWSFVIDVVGPNMSSLVRDSPHVVVGFATLFSLLLARRLYVSHLRIKREKAIQEFLDKVADGIMHDIDEIARVIVQQSKEVSKEVSNGPSVDDEEDTEPVCDDGFSPSGCDLYPIPSNPPKELKPQDLSKLLSEPPHDWDMDDEDEDEDDEDEDEDEDDEDDDDSDSDDEFNDPTYVPGEDEDAFTPRNYRYRAARSARRNGKTSVKTSGAKVAKVDPNASNPLYILNPTTGKYVKREGAVGRRILAAQVKDEKADEKADGKKVRKPLSAYMHFTKDARLRIIKRNPECRFGEIGKMLGKEWRELSESDKAVYYKMAEDDRRRYETEVGL